MYLHLPGRLKMVIHFSSATQNRRYVGIETGVSLIHENIYDVLQPKSMMMGCLRTEVIIALVG
jgi:hypothetical protein